MISVGYICTSQLRHAKLFSVIKVDWLMTESRMAVQYADITAVPEFVRQNGNIG